MTRPFALGRQAAAFAGALALLVPLTAHAGVLRAGFARVEARTLSPAAMRGALIGSLAARMPLELDVHLRGQRGRELQAFDAAVTSPRSPFFRRYLTPEQFGRYFGADPAAYVRTIVSLRQHGFVIDDLPANRTDVIVHAPAATVEAFFQTPIELRLERGRAFYANRYAPVAPAGLPIEAVSGLDDYGFLHPMLRRRPNAVINGYFSWGPADMATAYDLNPLYGANLDGKGVTIANATCGAALTSDLQLFQRQFALPAAILTSTELPKGSRVTSTCGGPSGYGNGESSMDADWALAVAREATFHQVVARGPSNHYFDLVYSYIVNDLGSSVHVVTTSWGTCERDMKGTASLKIDEKLFAQAVAEGQHWFSASGDNGTDDCEDGGRALSVDFPGSSPYVTSVGGTNVRARIANGNVTGWRAETTWNESNSNGASGGGRSILYPKPSYQAGVTPNDGARDVPDVALLADDVNDGVWIAQGGKLQGGWGGTSEAAPQWAGLLAIVEQRYHDGAIADPHARLYQLGASGAYSTLFHDVVKGNNGVRDSYGTFSGFNAGPGFDLCTGWGSYIGAALVQAY
jgi:subtilase family serine protease